jgi:hypothetical protein
MIEGDLKAKDSLQSFDIGKVEIYRREYYMISLIDNNLRQCIAVV